MEISTMQKLSAAKTSSYASKCAVDLDISRCIQAYGRPMPLNELARSIPIPPEKDSMLRRLMTLLVHQGIFMQTEEGYLLTPDSDILLLEGSKKAAFELDNAVVEESKVWGHLSEMFTDTGTGSLIQRACDGKQFWEVAKESLNLGNYFNEKMARETKLLMGGLVSIYRHIFDGLRSLVDVGGGTGTAIKIIAESFPGLRCTLFDLPHVVPEASKDDTFDVVGGDMFEKIPAADAIFLKNIIHNWNDENCVRILKRCKEAIESTKNNGGKVIVVDIIMDLESDDAEAVEISLIWDIKMMGLFGSKERYKQEWHDIIMGAGYSGYKICPFRLGVDSVIELYP